LIIRKCLPRNFKPCEITSSRNWIPSQGLTPLLK
jgi:hypothetical protein